MQKPIKVKLYQLLILMFTLAVLVPSALAVEMTSGDVVFVMFGNNTEFVQNLGPRGTVLAPGNHTFPIAPATLSAVSGTNTVSWAIVGYDSSGSLVLLAGSSIPPSSYTPAQLSQVSVANPTNVAAIWEAQSSGDGLSQKLLPASDTLSFTYNFGTSGTLAGGFPVSMQGMFGSTLTVISGDYNSNALLALGQAQVYADGSNVRICNPSCPPVPNVAPTAVSLTPANIVTTPGTAQTFTAVYSDPNGYQNISTASLALAGSLHNERVDYNRVTNKFSIMGLAGNCSPGDSATLTNGNLSLSCNDSSASGSGTTLTITFNLTGQPPLSGYAYLLTISVTDLAAASNSKTPGTWVINRQPGAGAASPMNSTTPVGMQQTFTIIFSDPDGYQNIAAANFYLSGNGGLHNEWLHYLSAPNLFTMLDAPGVCVPGQATTLSNSYSTLDCATSSVSGSGTNLTVIFRVTPKPPSSGLSYIIFNGTSDQAGAAFGTFGGTWGVP